jgi:hypothetical protein
MNADELTYALQLFHDTTGEANEEDLLPSGSDDEESYVPSPKVILICSP